MKPFREWMRGVDEAYTNPAPQEPIWVDRDSGPDETAEGQVEKFWMPVTLPEAVTFWQAVNQSTLQQIAAERIDLVDHFVRRVRDPFEPPEPLLWSRRARFRQFRRRIARRLTRSSKR